MLDQIIANLKNIEITDKPLLDSIFAMYPPIISDLTFSTIYAWGEYNLFCYINEHLFIGKIKNNNYYLYQPLGPNAIEIMTNLTSIKWVNVPAIMADCVLSDQSKYLVRDLFDYVYLRQNMVNMNGPKMGCFRRHVKQCKKLYSITVCVLDRSLIGQCIAMNERWLASRNLKKNDADYNALIRSLNNYEYLGLFGLVFIIDDVVEGFRIGETLNKNTHVSHFAKNNSKYRGLGEYMLHILANTLNSEIVYINLEQDIGNIGLRNHKQKMCPIKMIEKYNYV